MKYQLLATACFAIRSLSTVFQYHVGILAFVAIREEAAGGGGKKSGTKLALVGVSCSKAHLPVPWPQPPSRAGHGCRHCLNRSLRGNL